MALVFYEKDTGLVRRTVFDETNTDDALEVLHPAAPDEAIFHIDLKFNGMGTFDLADIQRQVSKFSGLIP